MNLTSLSIGMSLALGAGSIGATPLLPQSADEESSGTWRMVELDMEVVPLPFADVLSLEGRMLVELTAGT